MRLAQNRKDPSFVPAFDADKPQRFLTALGAREGFDVIPLTPDFRAASARDGRELWEGRGGKFLGHWNDEGHALAADVMRRYFEAHLDGLSGTAR